ncbi:MAG: hypothetical protein U0519_02985 [Candidatus Gracilibacteria bacterium]
MKKTHPTIQFFMVATLLLGLNILILGKTMAQNQSVSLAVMAGNLTLAVPQSVSFSRLITTPGNASETTTVLNPNNNLQTIQVIDPSTGGQFHVNLTLKNLSNQGGDVIPYTNFGVITLHTNQVGNTIDYGSNNNPPGSNNVSSDAGLSYYFGGSADPSAFPGQYFTSFPVDSLDPDPNDAGSVSIPVTLMQRTIDTPSAGVYSVGLALRANIPADQPSGNFSGELTFSLDP